MYRREHSALLQLCQYVFLHVKPPSQPPNHFHLLLQISGTHRHIICHPFQLFLLLEELSNITYSCLLTLTVVQNLLRSNQLNVSRFVIQCQLLPSHSPEIPCRPSKGVPTERLRLVKWFISHRLHTGACVNLVLLIYLLTYILKNHNFWREYIVFAVAGPIAWNDLPAATRVSIARNSNSSKILTKTHLFNTVMKWRFGTISELFIGLPRRLLRGRWRNTCQLHYIISHSTRPRLFQPRPHKETKYSAFGACSWSWISPEPVKMNIWLLSLKQKIECFLSSYELQCPSWDIFGEMKCWTFQFF